MAVTFTGSNGLFTRLGKIFFISEEVATFQATLAAEIEDALDEYSIADIDMPDALIGSVNASQRSCAAVFSSMRSAARNTIIEMVNDDNTLPDKNITTALVELIRQMLAGSPDDIEGNSVSATTVAADANNVGNGTVIGSVRSPGIMPRVDTLDTLQRVRAEDVTITCTTDQQGTGGVGGRETFSVRGERAIAATTDPAWPGGSGVNRSLRVTDPAESGVNLIARNLLTNSAMETFTVSNTLDNWTYVVGAAGTDILEEGTTVYRGSKSLEFANDASTLIKISQEFAVETGGKLKPNTLYAISCRVQATGSIATGTLQLSVKDGTHAGTIIDSTNAKLVINAAAISTGSWDHETHTFGTGRDLPSQLTFVIEMTVAATTATTIHIDDLCVAEMVQIEKQGPSLIIVPGATDFVEEDTLKWQPSNGDSSKFAKYMDQIVGMRELGLQLPYDASPTVADSLIA